MYAIIESGGKQYKVEKGDHVRVEKLEAEAGSEVSFDAMLTAAGKTVRVGKPFVKGVKVTAKVLQHNKDRKIIVFKYKAKKNYRRKQGHRQPYSVIEILEIG